MFGELKARGDGEFGPSKEQFYFQNFLNTGKTREEYWKPYEIASMKAENAFLADMTPANGYAKLESLVEFNRELDKRGFVGKPVLTLRDPIAQILSQTQFQKSLAKNASNMEEIGAYISRYYSGTATFSEDKITADVVLKEGLSAFEPLGIPTWREIVTNSLTAFGEVYIQFHEQMFCEEEMRKLQETYLGIEYRPMNFKKKEFSFPAPNKLTKKDKKKIFLEYPRMQDNYNFAVEVWGQDHIDSIWQNPL